MKDTANYRMLTLARETRGMSQKELSNKVSTLNQGNLSKIERGLLPISKKILVELSQVLGFPISFFYQRELKSSLNEIYYRKKSSVLKKPLRQFEAQMDLVVKLIDNLMHSIDMPTCQIPTINLEEGFTPEIAARKTREFLNIPKGPIDNIVDVIEKNGIIVQLIDAPNKIEGCTMISDSNIVIIFVNKNHPADKQRFTLVHELGHIIMHLFFDIPLNRDVEKETDSFTAEFLMPERDCIYDLRYLTFSKIPDLKTYWGTSYATIIRRAFDLRIIDAKKKKSLYIQRSQAGYMKNEPNCGVKFHNPRLLKHIVDFYIKEMEYSQIELCNILHISEDDFNTLLLNKPSFNLKVVSNKKSSILDSFNKTY